MKYILTSTAKRKGARRHIVLKNDSIDYLRMIGEGLLSKYIVEIYDSKWNLLERVK